MSGADAAALVARSEWRTIASIALASGRNISMSRSCGRSPTAVRWVLSFREALNCKDALVLRRLSSRRRGRHQRQVVVSTFASSFARYLAAMVLASWPPAHASMGGVRGQPGGWPVPLLLKRSWNMRLLLKANTVRRRPRAGRCCRSGTRSQRRRSTMVCVWFSSGNKTTGEQPVTVEEL